MKVKKKFKRIINMLVIILTATLFSLALFSFSGCSGDKPSGLESKYAEQINYTAESVTQKPPFTKGVNFAQWFESDKESLRYFADLFTEKDFIDAKSMGIEVIRLPVFFHNFTDGEPNYTLDGNFLKLLDVAVGWAEKHGIYLILDNHSFSSEIPTAGNIKDILIPVWRQIAARYKDRSGYIIYEILNEPWGDAINSIWPTVQGEVIDAIREIDTKHTVVVTGANWGGHTSLSDLPKYDDDNLIYSFHYYGPFVFTHQGATWGDSGLDNMKNLPFPADAHEMPPIPDDLKGNEWIEWEFDNWSEIASIAALEKELDVVVKFANERGARILCGEFGAFMPNMLNEDRVRWYQVVTKLMDIRGISQTSWSYYGGFGLFETSEMFESAVEFDLNTDIVEALGFTPIAQSERSVIDGPFKLYDGFPFTRTARAWYSNESEFDFYGAGENGYALSWGNVERYDALTFGFAREIDWAKLAQNDYAISIRVKADKDASFQARFVNNLAEGADGIPWRLIKDIEIKGGEAWQTILIPFSDMTEWGAWVNETGYVPPSGQFAWEQVDTLQFVPENNDLKGITLTFESIEIVGDGTPDSNGGLSGWAVVGIVIGAVAVIAVAGFILYRRHKLLKKKKRRKTK